MVHKQLIN